MRATVADDAGGTSAPAFYRYVIVFDPTGAFTTDTGFYDVPGQGKKKAHFSFTAAFPASQAVPNGTTRIWIPGGQLDFESTAIEMLVASGNRAQFWGTGTLNGAPARSGLRQSAVAAGRRMRSASSFGTQSGTTVRYDTQPGAAQDAPLTTAIDGGNIRIGNP